MIIGRRSHRESTNCQSAISDWLCERRLEVATVYLLLRFFDLIKLQIQFDSREIRWELEISHWTRRWVGVEGLTKRYFEFATAVSLIDVLGVISGRLWTWCKMVGTHPNRSKGNLWTSETFKRFCDRLLSRSTSSFDDYRCSLANRGIRPVRALDHDEWKLSLSWSSEIWFAS